MYPSCPTKKLIYGEDKKDLTCPYPPDRQPIYRLAATTAKTVVWDSPWLFFSKTDL
jgi:hypothetical protein